MPKPYSMDLRERALARLQAGESARSVSKSLSIGVSTAIRWQQRHRSTGSVAPLPTPDECARYIENSGYEPT